MYYMRIMRLILIITIVLLSSCSSKYKGAHTDYKKFKKDIEYCLQKSCIYKTKKVLENLSIISSALAYGGGGGGGGGGSGGSFQQNKISYKIFNLCLQEKGYTKDDNGIFELPHLTCN